MHSAECLERQIWSVRPCGDILPSTELADHEIESAIGPHAPERLLGRAPAPPAALNPSCGPTTPFDLILPVFIPQAIHDWSAVADIRAGRTHKRPAVGLSDPGVQRRGLGEVGLGGCWEWPVQLSRAIRRSHSPHGPQGAREACQTCRCGPYVHLDLRSLPPVSPPGRTTPTATVVRLHRPPLVLSQVPIAAPDRLVSGWHRARSPSRRLCFACSHPLPVRSSALPWLLCCPWLPPLVSRPR